MLAAYILAQGNNFPLIFYFAFMGVNYNAKLRACLADSLLADLRECGKGVGGRALWFSKPEVLQVI